MPVPGCMPPATLRGNPLVRTHWTRAPRFLRRSVTNFVDAGDGDQTEDGLTTLFGSEMEICSAPQFAPHDQSTVPPMSTPSVAGRVGVEPRRLHPFSAELLPLGSRALYASTHASCLTRLFARASPPRLIGSPGG